MAEKLKKSLPKRCVNERRKERRKRSWERGRARKRARQNENERAHRRNLALVAEGQPTPWEIANGWSCGQQAIRRESRKGWRRIRKAETK